MTLSGDVPRMETTAAQRQEVDSSLPTPAPSLPPLIVPPSSLALRRQKNSKKLSLIVPTTSVPASLVSPSNPSQLLHCGSLPPSPVSLVSYIGVEGSETEDRTIGRLMYKQQADEMREAMKGGRGMRRRTSIPALNLGAAAYKPITMVRGGSGGGGAGSAVQMIRGDSIERTKFERDGSAMEVDQVVEEFPYALGPREIFPGIFLGSEQNARDGKVLKDWGIGFVLNVAKEVDCPWTDEVIYEGDEEVEESTEGGSSVSLDDVPRPPLPSTSTTPSPLKHKHRRTMTHANISIAATSTTPKPPPFVRSTTSTPNLQMAYAAHPSQQSPPPAFSPTVNPEDNHHVRAASSNSARERSPPPRSCLPSVVPHTVPAPPQPSSLRFPSNTRSVRPTVEYLWLKWGHDESDLVEGGKFQIAFDFIDKAREKKQNILIHCQCGVSRSGTVVIAYCMREAARALEEGRVSSELAGITGMHDAYSFVKEKAEFVGPNLGLVFQLVAYERHLSGHIIEDEVEPPYPHVDSEMANVEDPRTPHSSETSSDSHLSTPESGSTPLSPSLSMSFKSSFATPPGTTTSRPQDSTDATLVSPSTWQTSTHPSNTYSALAFSPPRTALLVSTPTAMSFSFDPSPTSLIPSSTPRVISRSSSLSSELDEGTRSRGSFGGSQSAKERRDSHKRVFSSDLPPGLFNRS